MACWKITMFDERSGTAPLSRDAIAFSFSCDGDKGLPEGTKFENHVDLHALTMRTVRFKWRIYSRYSRKIVACKQLGETIWCSNIIRPFTVIWVWFPIQPIIPVTSLREIIIIQPDYVFKIHIPISSNFFIFQKKRLTIPQYEPFSTTDQYLPSKTAQIARDTFHNGYSLTHPTTAPYLSCGCRCCRAADGPDSCLAGPVSTISTVRHQWKGKIRKPRCFTSHHQITRLSRFQPTWDSRIWLRGRTLVPSPWTAGGEAKSFKVSVPGPMVLEYSNPKKTWKSNWAGVYHLLSFWGLPYPEISGRPRCGCCCGSSFSFGPVAAGLQS